MGQQTIDRVEALENAGVRLFRRIEPLPLERPLQSVGRISPRVDETRSGDIVISGLVVDPREEPNPGLILLDAGSGSLWCCGFGDRGATVETSPATGDRGAIKWTAVVPRSFAMNGSDIVAYAILRSPDRFVPLEGFVDVRLGMPETVYSSSETDGPE